MFQKYLIPHHRLGWRLFAIFTVLSGDKTSPTGPAFTEAVQSPDADSVSGVGLIEANTENISLGTSVGGIVSQVFVQIGNEVKLVIHYSPLMIAPTRRKLKIRQAAAQVAEAQLAETKYELDLAAPLAVKGVTTGDEVIKKRFAMQKNEAQLVQAHAELSLPKQTWTD